MAQAQVLCQRPSGNEFSFLCAGPSQPPLSANCSFNTSVSFQNIDNTMADYPMTQPLLHSQYAPETQTQAQRWSSQRGFVPKYEMDVAATIDNASNGRTPVQDRFYNVLDWNGVMTADQYSMSESDNAFRQNQDLVYNPMAAQTMVDKNLSSYLGLQSWATSGSSHGPHGVKVNGSDADTRSSLSPKSYFSDQLGSETTSYSPAQISDQASSLRTYSGFHTSFRSVKESPSMNASSRYQLAIQNDQVPTVSDCSSLPRIDPSIMPSRMLSAKPKFNNGIQTTTYQHPHQCSSEFPALQNESTSSPSWHFRGYANDLSGLPPPQQIQDVGTFPNILPSHGRGRTLEEIADLNRSRAAALAQDRHPDRSHGPRIVDTQAQRKVNDDILIQGKKDGLTYKDIRKKLVGEKPAESTLRGRYRALTKERKDRVRKPVWTKKDIQLLNEFVEQEFDRIESILPSSHSISLDQKLVKVAWKKVADYIDGQGGSYHFGNSTCKRKWMEVNTHALE